MDKVLVVCDVCNLDEKAYYAGAFSYAIKRIVYDGNESG
jgi:hypothetical protein